MKKQNYLTYLLLVIGIVLLLNILSSKFFLRLDFTEDQRYTLSKATKEILKNLKEPITITAYFSENVHQQITKTRHDFKEMLVEYATRSNGMIKYEFVNPDTDEKEKKAQADGIQPMLINVTEKDQVKQQKAYLGVKVMLGESESDIIPFMQLDAMEYALTTSIKKISAVDKPVIGLLQGHNEAAPGALAQVLQQLEILYVVEPITLSDTTDVLSKFSTVAIISPKDTFPSSHLQQIDKFLANGGKLFLAINPVTGNLQNASGVESFTGIEQMLKTKGLSIESGFVIDASCGSVAVRQQMGPFPVNTQMQFPFLPIVSNFADHATTKGLESVLLQFPTSINFSGNGLKFTPLIKTSDQSGELPAPLYFDIQKQWTEADFPLKNITVAAIIEGKFAPTAVKEGKLIIITDGEFAVNSEQNQPLPVDNVNFVVNSLDWMTDDSGLSELRTKGVTSRPLDEMSDGKKTFLKYLNFFLPLLLVVAYGVLRWQRNKIVRIKRQNPNYIG